MVLIVCSKEQSGVLDSVTAFIGSRDRILEILIFPKIPLNGADFCAKNEVYQCHMQRVSRSIINCPCTALHTIPMVLSYWSNLTLGTHVHVNNKTKARQKNANFYMNWLCCTLSFDVLHPDSA